MVFVGTGYGSAYFAALSYPAVMGALYVPVAGPWLAMQQTEKASAKALLAANGALQGAGMILLIGGVVGAGRQLVRKPDEEARVRVTASVGRQAFGLALGARF